jgi:hypothetical protein
MRRNPILQDQIPHMLPSADGALYEKPSPFPTANLIGFEKG